MSLRAIGSRVSAGFGRPIMSWNSESGAATSRVMHRGIAFRRAEGRTSRTRSSARSRWGPSACATKGRFGDFRLEFWAHRLRALFSTSRQRLRCLRPLWHL